MAVHLHPILAGFPVALLTLVVGLEVANAVRPSPWLYAAIRVNLVAAAIAAVCAFFSGYVAEDLAQRTFKISPEVIETHRVFGRCLLFVVLPAAAVRFVADSAKFGAGIFRAVYYVLLVLSAGLLAWTGYLGGELIFTHGAGVAASIPAAVP